MIKKALALTFAVIILIGVLALSGCWQRNYEWSEDSFSLEINLSQEYAKIGDEVEISTIFRNLSGRNLLVTVLINEHRPARLEDIVHFGCFGWTRSIPRTLQIPKKAVVTIKDTLTWYQPYYLVSYSHSYIPDYYSYEPFYCLDCCQYCRYCAFCVRTLFHIGRTNQNRSSLWNNSRKVVLRATATLNFINEDKTYE